jgi:UDPglucose--hexose-1-phosphate uridylyltransferase
MPEFRKDPVVNRWVIISAERSKRPQPLRATSALPWSEPCPFCSGNESMTPPEILAFRDPRTGPDSPGWQVRVVPNKYPAVVETGDLSHQTNHLYASQNGVGTHEVIVENPEHCIDMADLNERQFDAVLRAYRDRMAELQKDRRWHHVLIFKNQGGAAGATLEHVHSQLIALPMIPREVDDEWRAVKEYYGRRRCCLYCDIIEEERLRECRVVAENDGFIVCCPFAPRFPFETWILPRKHAAFFGLVPDTELTQLGFSLRETLCRLNAALGHPAFNYALHSTPLHEAQSDQYHWHLEIMPKTIEAAGFEWGSGFYMNPVSPEDAARHLRDVLR